MLLRALTLTMKKIYNLTPTYLIIIIYLQGLRLGLGRCLATPCYIVGQFSLLRHVWDIRLGYFGTQEHNRTNILPAWLSLTFFSIC